MHHSSFPDFLILSSIQLSSKRRWSILFYSNFFFRRDGSFGRWLRGEFEWCMVRSSFEVDASLHLQKKYSVRQSVCNWELTDEKGKNRSTQIIRKKMKIIQHVRQQDEQQQFYGASLEFGRLVLLKHEIGHVAFTSSFDLLVSSVVET